MLGDEEHEAVAMQATSTVNLRMVDIEGREVCGSQQFTQNLLQDALPIGNTTLTLGNSRIPEISLNNDSVLTVLTVLLKPETLNQTRNLLQ